MTHTPRERAVVTAALVAVQVFFGVHYLSAKLVLREFPPAAWAALRVGVAAALLLAAAAAWKKIPHSPRDLGRLALYALFGVVINQICFIEGLARTTATHSAIINTLIPVGTLLFAVLLGREGWSGTKVASIACAFAGVLLVVRPAAGALTSTTLTGDLLTLANALSYSFFLVISKRLLGRVDPIGATAVLLGFGAIGVGAFGARSLAAVDFGAISATAWANGAFIVLFPTIGAYFLIYWALARAESSLVALFTYLQPVIAGVSAAVILGERPPATTLAGAALIFLGVAVAVRGGRAHPSLTQGETG